jgi:hypothetical protein
VDSLDSLELAVPADQRPVNELASIKQAFLYSWAVLPLDAYVTRLAVVFGTTFALLSGPIANQTFPVMRAVSTACHRHPPPPLPACLPACYISPPLVLPPAAAWHSRWSLC